MSKFDIDANPKHLYHPFRQKLARVLEETAKATGEEWMIYEGLRTPERQLWLYAQGRTRPGRIITWMKTPRWHGAGLAADCYPRKRPFSAPQSLFVKYREIYLAHGLTNPAWEKGDRGHVQWGDNAIRLVALQWIRDGFPSGLGSGVLGDVEGDIKVYVDDQPIMDADASLDQGHVYTALRPIADAFDWVIAEVKKGQGQLGAHLISDHLDIWVPIVMKVGRGFCRADQLPLHAVWDTATKSLRLTTAR